MRLGEGVEWATHCLVVLALLPEGEALSARRLAEYHDVPGPYLAKSLQALATAGLVTSRAGRRGGYRLARPASAVSLLDVITALEGSQPAFRCTEIRRRGPAAVARGAYGPVCAIARAMWRAEESWRRELAATSIGDLAQTVLSEAPPRAVEKGGAWLGRVLEVRRGSAG